MNEARILNELIARYGKRKEGRDFDKFVLIFVVLVVDRRRQLLIVTIR
jgi:hypothetical protein